MKAKSFKGVSAEQIKNELHQCMVDGFKPTLAFVFCSSKQDHNAISAILENEQIAIFGSTTAGEFIDNYEGQGSAAILLLDINPEYFTILFEEIGERNVRDVARQLGEKALKIYNKPAFILAANGLQKMAKP
jgi:hypothetical protein